MPWIKIAAPTEEGEIKTKENIYKFWVPVIPKQWKRDSYGDMPKKPKEVDPEDLPISVVKEMANDFNETFIKENFNDYIQRIPKDTLESLVMDSHITENGIIITAKTNRAYTEEEIQALQDDIEGQCSDGWGEGFEQQDIQGYNISTWDIEDEGKDIRRIN